MELAGWLLLTLCFILVLLPPRWDPAIRLKEWNDYDEAKEIERLVRLNPSLTSPWHRATRWMGNRGTGSPPSGGCPLE